MRRIGPATPVVGLCLGLVLAVWAGPVSAARSDLPPLEELYSKAWYHTEVVVFQRPATLDHLTPEALTRPPQPMRREVRTFRTPDRPPSADFTLYPATRAYLSFPYLDQERLPDFTATDRDGGGADDTEAVTDGPTGRAAPAIAPRLAPDPLLDFLDELARFEAALAEQSDRWQPEAQLTLRPEAGALAREAFEVLIHRRWLQAVPERARPEPVLIQAGPEFAGRHVLEGSLAVTLGRYLHFDTDLYYTEPLLGQAPVDVPRPPRAGMADEVRAPLTEEMLEPAGVMQLRESRRLRSEETHYLDHPKLGVLVRVDPVQPPEGLTQAYERLRSSLEEGKQ